MRHLKRISFFIYSCLLFAGGFYGHIKLEEAFYPGRSARAAESPVQEAPGFVTAASSASGITCDTQLITEEWDLQTGQMTETEGRVPEKYVGMNREQFVSCLKDTFASPLLEERSRGLCSLEVLSFSPEKIKIKKCYQKQDFSEKFYAAVEENRVVIYEADKVRVYLKTDIDARLLPREIRSDILRGWEIGSRAELEKFLVSYSG